jgi:hypothetical protein
MRLLLISALLFLVSCNTNIPILQLPTHSPFIVNKIEQVSEDLAVYTGPDLAIYNPFFPPDIRIVAPVGWYNIGDTIKLAPPVH